MNILDSAVFKYVMYFKFFMVTIVWGLTPILIPARFLPFFGLYLNAQQIMWLQIWGAVVLMDFFLYLYIYKNPHKKLSKHFLLFAIIDNGGFGLILLILTPLLKLPWGIWANVPFQLFFGYWFWRFYNEGRFM